MRIFAVCFLALLGMVNSSQGAVVLSAVQAVPGNITVGNTAVFNLFISETTTPFGLEGIDVAINVESAAAGDLVSGTIVSTLGTVPYTGGWFPNTFDGLNDAGTPANFSSNTSGGFGSFSVNAVPQLFATVTLDTAGATAGTYQLTLDSILVADFGVGLSPAAVNVSYTIQAVPEPTSIALVSLIGGAAGVRFWRKKRAAAV